MNFKSSIYKILHIWNIVGGIRKGKGRKHIGRRVTGRATGKIIRRLLK